MKKLKIIISTILISLLVISPIFVSASTLSDEGELNWYFVSRGKGNLPEGAKESIGFISDYDAYFLGTYRRKSPLFNL